MHAHIHRLTPIHASRIQDQQSELLDQIEKLDVKRVLDTYKLSVAEAADQSKQVCVCVSRCVFL